MSSGEKRAIGIALAGGGPLGAIWEVGALVALQDALVGIDLADCDVYVGVSSGAVLAAGLANGLSPRDIHRMFIESETKEAFHPETLLRPAVGEYARRLARLPGLTVSALGRWWAEAPKGFFASFHRLGHAVPTGIFDNRGLAAFIGRLLSAPGRSNDFRALRHRLYLVATDLDSGHTVHFGKPGWDHVPIAEAVAASAALPGLFPPVEIDGRHYVDGALTKTLHASVALEEGVGLLFCVNPLVPFDSDLCHDDDGERISLVERGLPTVLSQTFRAIIHSRMRVGMARYRTEFPDADVLLFEPAKSDADMFFTNVFSYSGRRRLAQHAYEKTLADLRRDRERLGPILAKHGVRLDDHVIEQKRPRISASPLDPKPRRLHDAVLDLDHTLDRLTGALRRRVADRQR